ncbi:imidazolonepropionase [Mesorhizobium sp. M1312]|uniref:imidazolonepropionase n=1 Tax=unclassified Mesorhizobium TaxID=325217 RepID=UPI003335E690
MSAKPENGRTNPAAVAVRNSALGNWDAATRGHRSGELLVTNIAELTPVNEFGMSSQRGPLRSLRSITNAAVYAVDGKIRRLGPAEDVLASLPNNSDPIVLDASGRAVVPGFVDCHTHLLYAGSRADEYPMRIAGAGYSEIAATGGGVARTIRESGTATPDVLESSLNARLERAVLNGTTTAEVKTGYWVEPEGELAALEIIARATRCQPLDLVATFHVALGTPGRFKDVDAQAAFVIDEVLPVIAPHARFCDIVCDAGGFSVEGARRILRAAVALGMQLKIHADEFSAAGGAELAAELGAASADHLCYLREGTPRALAQSATIAILLPATRHHLLAPCFADARQLIEQSVPIALGTDHGPSSPSLSMPFVMGLACSWLRMDPAEALVAATWNAACAIGCVATAGCLDVGRPADMVVLDTSTYRELPYFIDQRLIRNVVKNGEVLSAQKR